MRTKSYQLHEPCKHEMVIPDWAVRVFGRRVKWCKKCGKIEDIRKKAS